MHDVSVACHVESEGCINIQQNVHWRRYKIMLGVEIFSQLKCALRLTHPQKRRY